MHDHSLEQVCKNCGHTFTEKFCNRCGQQDAHRITITHVFHDLVHIFLHADKGILLFIPRLVTQPGVLAKEFIQGKRRIFNPFQYLVIIVGVVLFLLAQSGFYESLLQANTRRVSTAPSYFKQGITDFSFFVRKYGNLVTLLALPIFAFFSWLLFKKKGYNYAEHVTIQVFAQSQINTINILFILLFMVTGTMSVTSTLATILLMICCFIITYRQIFSLSWGRAIFKAVSIFVLSYVVQVFIMMIGMFVYILILKSRAHH